MTPEDALSAGKEWQELSDFESVDIDSMMLSPDTVGIMLEVAEIMDNNEE